MAAGATTSARRVCLVIVRIVTMSQECLGWSTASWRRLAHAMAARRRPGVINPAQFNCSVARVINNIGGASVTVARLSDTSDIHQILYVGLDCELGVCAASHIALLELEGNWNMSVTAEAKWRRLMSEVSGGSRLIEHVLPAFGRVQACMDYCEVVDV